MDMTGDPNQRNNTSMFGFETSYPSPSLDFSRFNAGVVSVASPAPSTSGVENSQQCLFATNSSSPFSMNDSIQPTAFVPYNSGYAFPSASVANMPSPVNRFAFPFPQGSAPSEGSSGFLESSGSFLENSMPVNNSSNTNPFLNSELNWSQNTKPVFTFHAKPANAPSTNSRFIMKPLTGTFGCKRKTDSPPLQPLKQHITEERMAEHMSRLHISSQTASANESEPVRERRLYMCEEMQRLQAESIIPAQILEQINRPCTALVPWRPPIVPPLVKENNNNDEEQDNNIMEESDGNGVDMES